MESLINLNITTFAWQIEVSIFKICYLAGRLIKLVIPPFTKGRTQFVKGKVEQTSSVARARIHIKRVIGRIKDFRIMNFRVPLTMVDLLDDIFTVASALVNLTPPLVPLIKKSNNGKTEK